MYALLLVGLHSWSLDPNTPSFKGWLCHFQTWAVSRAPLSLACVGM